MLDIFAHGEQSEINNKSRRFTLLLNHLVYHRAFIDWKNRSSYWVFESQNACLLLLFVFESIFAKSLTQNLKQADFNTRILW